MATNRPMKKTNASRNVRPATSQPSSRNAKPNPPARARDRVDRAAQLLLQRALLDLNLLGQIGDLADLGIHPGAEDDGARPAAHERGAGEKDVGQLDPEKFAGDQNRLIGFVAARRELDSPVRDELSTSTSNASVDARVGRHQIAFFEHDQIAGDQLGGVNFPHVAVTDDSNFCAISCCSISSARSDLYSCRNANRPLTTITVRIAMPSCGRSTPGTKQSSAAIQSRIAKKLNRLRSNLKYQGARRERCKYCGHSGQTALRFDRAQAVGEIGLRPRSDLFLGQI